VVQYPWHPLFGHSVQAQEWGGSGEAALLCSLEGHAELGRFVIPAWMFEEATCSRMPLLARPQVSWETLGDLRDFLRRLDVGRRPAEIGTHEDETAAAQTADVPPRQARIGGDRVGRAAAEDEEAGGRDPRIDVGRDDHPTR